MENLIKVHDSKNGIVKNGEVYALGKALKESGYAMRTNIDENEEFEKMIKRGNKLGSCPAGSGHCNYLLGIIVRMDVTFTNKVWVEAERYHWFDITTSQSTMHRITKFDLDKSYIKYVDRIIINRMKELVDEYNIIEDNLKNATDKYDILRLSEQKKEKYLNILYSNPAGFTLTAGISTNYLQLKTMVTQRYNHRLPEWHEFVKWCFNLPYFELLTGLSRDKYVIK